MKHIEIFLMEEDELSIDGQTRSAGNIEISDMMNGALNETN
jgi:hypothetical protein